MSKRIMRREFLSRTVAAVCSAPLFLPGSALGKDGAASPSESTSENERTQSSGATGGSSETASLSADNLPLSILASCSIPYWLDPVHDVPGGPAGAYWDGGITDYHLHLNYASMPDGAEPSLVLYPHFQQSVIPGWLDKFFKRRHRATAALSNVVVVSPNPAWIATLPNGKLPDRADFKLFGDAVAGRVKAWSRALAESERLRDEFAAWVDGRAQIDVQPLA